MLKINPSLVTLWFQNALKVTDFSHNYKLLVSQKRASGVILGYAQSQTVPFRALVLLYQILMVKALNKNEAIH